MFRNFKNFLIKKGFFGQFKAYLMLSERTEKKFPVGMSFTEEKINLIMNLLNFFIKVSEVADHLKKNIIYGKKYSIVDLGNSLEELKILLSKMDKVPPPIDLIKGSPVFYLDSEKMELFHGILGIYTESGELLQVFRSTSPKDYKNNPIDYVNLLEELGDLRWYEALCIRILNRHHKKDVEKNILKTNIKKLISRYPEKYDDEKALNRDLNKERSILEKHDLN